MKALKFAYTWIDRERNVEHVVRMLSEMSQGGQSENDHTHVQEIKILRIIPSDNRSDGEEVLLGKRRDHYDSNSWKQSLWTRTNHSAKGKKGSGQRGFTIGTSWTGERETGN